MDELMLTEEGKAELSELQGADDDTMKSFAGCTSAVVLVTRNEVYCANAGDSRSVLAARNTARDLSVDHKPDDPQELARIEASGNFID
jgi:protein phosphatase 2C family protein 2/3